VTGPTLSSHLSRSRRNVERFTDLLPVAGPAGIGVHIGDTIGAGSQTTKQRSTPIDKVREAIDCGLPMREKRKRPERTVDRGAGTGNIYKDHAGKVLRAGSVRKLRVIAGRFSYNGQSIPLKIKRLD